MHPSQTSLRVATDFEMIHDRAARLEAENKRLRAALKPFADVAREFAHVLPDSDKNTMHWAVPKVGEFRAALRAYEQSVTEKD